MGLLGLSLQGPPALQAALHCPKRVQWGPGLAASGGRQKEKTA